jgi:hypothetical protein
MLSAQELNTFDSIARHQPRFREWVEGELRKQTDILVQAMDETQIRRAQGYALCLKQIITNLDVSLTSR